MKPFFGGSVLQSDLMSAVRMTYLVIFPSLSGTGVTFQWCWPLSGLLAHAKLLASLWMGSGQGFIGGGKVHGDSKVHSSALWERTCNSLEKFLLRLAGLWGACP